MKKYISKILGLSLICILSVAATGCSDLLDQRPQGVWVEGDNPAGSFETDIFTLYANIRGENVTSSLPALAIHNFRSEDVEKGSTASDGADFASYYDDFDYTTIHGSIQNYWSDNYRMIHTANRVLDAMNVVVEGGEELSANDLINKSEAHFFRAFAYFNLVRAFGEVPLIDFRIDDAAEANVPKSPAADIYTLIDADLTEAERNLPTSWDAQFIGRLTWGAAKSLHARTYMMRNDWNNMYTAATEVINSGIYNLNTPYSSIFRETGENTSESVFELQCTATSAMPESTNIGSRYAQVQGVRGAGNWDLGWGWHCPTEQLASAFEEGDPRKDETLLYFVRTGEDPATIPANEPYGERPVANGDVTNKYYNKKVYTNPNTRLTYNRYGFWINIRIIRYSDVVLMAAESANELGNTAEALNYLEMVRARARGNNADVLPRITSTDPTVVRNAIRHERRVELAMEWDRFYDLVRWGIAREVLHAAGKTSYQERHALLPLPQAEVDRSNGVLIQNPNY